MPNPNAETDEYAGFYAFDSMEEIFYEDGYSESKFSANSFLLKGSETNGILEDGMYAAITLDDNFIQCIGGNSLEDSMAALYMLNSATFSLINYNVNSVEQCMMNHQIFSGIEEVLWVIKFCEESDNMMELYGGLFEGGLTEYFNFIVSIPYYNPSHL